MILKCSVGDILTAVDKVWETTDIKKAVIASNIYFKGIHKADASWLYVYSTDYNTQCLTKIEVELDEDFEVGLDPESLIRGIRNTNHEQSLKLTRKEGAITVKSGIVTYKVQSIADPSFHRQAMAGLPKLEEPAMVCHPSIYVAGIKAVAFAVSNNINLYGVIRSVEIQGKDETIRFSGSDGNIAAVTELVCPKIKKPFKICISKEDVNTLVKIINLNPAGDVEVFEDKIFFKFPDTLMGFGKITGALPDIKKIIAKYPIDKSIKVEQKEFLARCQRAAKFARSGLKEHPIVVSYQEDDLSLSVGDYNDAKEGFKADKTVKMNSGYLTTAIGACSSKQIEVGFTASNVLIIKDLYKDEAVEMASDYVIMGQQ